MGSLIELRPPTHIHEPRRAAWGLVTRLVEREPARGRKAVMYVDDLAIVCVVAEVPKVGDRIHGDVPAVVDKVRVTRDGRVRIYARPAPIPLDPIRDEYATAEGSGSSF